MILPEQRQPFAQGVRAKGHPAQSRTQIGLEPRLSRAGKGAQPGVGVAVAHGAGARQADILGDHVQPRGKRSHGKARGIMVGRVQPRQQCRRTLWRGPRRKAGAKTDGGKGRAVGHGQSFLVYQMTLAQSGANCSARGGKSLVIAQAAPPPGT